MNKKRGSTIITVLMIAMVMVISASVIAIGVVYTTGGNANEKERQDITYAAEAGIDKALSNIVQSEAKGIAPPSTFSVNEFRNDYGIEVGVKLQKVGSEQKYKVTSTAKKGMKKKVVEATISKDANSGEVFSNLLCGSKIIVRAGSVNLGTGDINTSNNNAVIGGGSTLNPTNQNNFQYTLPQYNFEEMDKDPVTGKSIVTGSSSAEIISKLDDLERNKKGVRKISFKSSKIVLDYRVYLINSNNFVMHMPSSGGEFKNIIFICSGNYTIENTDKVKFTQSTVIGDEIIFDGIGAIHMSYSPHTKPDHPWYGYAPLSDSDLNFINKTIADNYAPNWPIGNSGSSISNGWAITDYQY